MKFKLVISNLTGKFKNILYKQKKFIFFKYWSPIPAAVSYDHDPLGDVATEWCRKYDIKDCDIVFKTEKPYVNLHRLQFLKIQFLKNKVISHNATDHKGADGYWISPEIFKKIHPIFLKIVLSTMNEFAEYDSIEFAKFLTNNYVYLQNGWFSKEDLNNDKLKPKDRPQYTELELYVFYKNSIYFPEWEF